jgi:hypothetical protein
MYSMKRTSAGTRARTREVGELVVVHAAHDHGVDLEPGSQARHRAMPSSTGACVVAP